VLTTSPLERRVRLRFVSRVPSSRVIDGIRIGAVATAATAGVIVGLGLRHQSALRPFLMSGRSTFAAITGLVAPIPLATTFGFLVHAAWMVLWGICFSMIATPLRGLHRLFAAILLAALAGVLSRSIAPAAMGAGLMAVQGDAQTLILLTVFALSLLAGIRLAPMTTRASRP
jgi:uncharacterized membrane protein YjgN (DUF898 family)